MEDKCRKSFEEIIKNAKVDVEKEYKRLCSLLYAENIYISRIARSVHQILNDVFKTFDIRDTALTLKDFDQTFGFNFISKMGDPNIEDLVNFCEYFYNLIQSFLRSPSKDDLSYYIKPYFLLDQVDRIVDKIMYKKIYHNNFVKFVPISPEAIAVAEIIDDDVSYDVLFYNHQSLKGKIKDKRDILVKLAKLLDAKRKELDSINKKLSSNLFFAYNNMNIRHNNCDPAKKEYYRKAIAEMPENELEIAYDDIYQTSLLAFLLLKNEKITQKFEKIKDKIEESN